MYSSVLRSKFKPAVLLTIAIMVNSSVLVWLGWRPYSSYLDMRHATEQSLRIEELRGIIVHLDETLTMSAYMAAATGDPQWEERYREAEPRLDAAIGEVQALAPETSDREAAAATDAANRALVDMEHRTFALVRQGQREQAQAVLFSGDYKAQKRIYIDGMNRLDRSLNESLRNSLAVQHRRAVTGIGAGAVVIPFAIIAWFAVFRAVRRWEATLKERTAELAQTNERLQVEIAGRSRAANRIARLNDLREDLIKPAELPDKLRIITDGIVGVFGADFARIWLTRPGDRCEKGCIHAKVTEGPHVCRDRDQCLHLMASSGRYTHVDGEGHRCVPFGCYKIGRIASAEESKFLTNSVQNDPKVHNHEWANEFGLVAFAGYRLLAANGKPMGVLALFSQQAILEEEDGLLEGLAHSTEQVVENAGVEAEIKWLNAGLEKRVEERTSQLALANEALREREATLGAITSSAQDGIMMMDQEGRISFWNSAAERILGWKKQEALGQNLHDFLVPTKFHEAHRRAFPLFQATGEGAAVGKTLELVAVRKDRTEIPVELSLSAIQLHDKWHAIGILRDISERKQGETKLAAVQEQLVAASREAGIADMATSVLHNVGNVLNSVNVSASLVADQMRASKVANVAKVAELVRQHVGDLGAFIAHDEKGRNLPNYLGKLADHLLQEQSSILGELDSLLRKVDHVKEVVGQQQKHARRISMTEEVLLAEVVEEALQLSGLANQRDGLRLVRELPDQPRLRIDKHKTLQILVNLLRNAKDALAEKGGDDPHVVVRIESAEGREVRVIVSDNGVGVADENATRIFSQGFTTKPKGHGFGLHSSALLAKELGGSLSLRKAEPGTGASFVLVLPVQPAETLK